MNSGRPRSPVLGAVSAAGARCLPQERGPSIYSYILESEAAMTTTAKVFKSGNSQAVRLPKEVRFPPQTHEVAIRREGRRIILEPLEAEEWPETFWEAFGGMPKGFSRPPQRRQARPEIEP